MKTLLDITLQYADKVDPPWAFDVLIPTAPSSFIPDSPSNLVRTGRFAHDIDIISGWNENDGSLFTLTKTDSVAGIWESLAIPSLTDGTKKRALELYPLTEFTATKQVSAQYFRGSRMKRDAEFTCPSLLLAEANAKYSAPTTGNYLFVLNQTLLTAFFEQAGTPYFGVSHFSDIAFVFNQATTRYADTATPSDKILSNLMSGSWAAFAASGHPSGLKGTLSDWREEGNSGRSNVQIIGGPRAGSESMSQYERLIERCEFWNSPEVTRQLQV
jgi:carboxylesterase type B